VLQVDDPLGIDATGRTARTDDETHVRQMILQVLFTAPGERVNRPSFGCGLQGLVFEPNSDTLAAASQLVVQGALQQWLGTVIAVDDVRIDIVDSVLKVEVGYTLRRTGEGRTLVVERTGGI
jgi:phage baseplate assembly protein W